MSAENPIGASSVSGLFRYAVIALVLAFPSICLLVNRGDSIGLGLLALMGFWVGFRDGFAHTLNREDRHVALAFFAFFVVAVLSYEFGQVTDAGFRFLGRDLRFLLIVPVLVLFRRYPPRVKTVFIGLAIGGLLTGAYSLVEFLHALPGYRAQAEADSPVMFGDLTASIVLALAAAYGLVASARKTWLTAGFLLCLLFGLTAIILSGTRGAWVALLLLLPLLLSTLKHVIGKQNLIIISVSMIVIFALSYTISKSEVRTRLHQITQEISLYGTSLRLLRAEGPNAKGELLCNDERRFLEGWLSLSRRGRGALSAEVVHDPALNAAGTEIHLDCEDGYVIRVTAIDTSPGWIAFHRNRALDHTRQVTHLLVRGSGYVTMQNTRLTQFESKHYEMISVSAPSSWGSALVITVVPGQSSWIVPLEGYFGEYHYTLMQTSIGLRFEMWRAAWHMFLDHPLLGIGTGAFYEDAQRMARRNLIPSRAAQFDHPHSDYFDALSSRGVLGFVALLTLLGVPAVYFLRALKNPQDTSHSLGLAGLMLVCGFAIFGLSDTVFIHSMNISWYVIYVALFTTLLKPGHAKVDAAAGLPVIL